MPDVDLPLPFESYAGDSPYIFASYAHKDGQLVFPQLSRLHEDGYRIWYDEGIDPGNEWPDDIAAALARASLFLVFVTKSSMESRNVRNEINFALNKNKAFLAIHLEVTTLPPGLELRMGDLQAILKWRMTEEHYRRKVLSSLPQETRQKTQEAGQTYKAVWSAPGGSIEAEGGGSATLTHPAHYKQTAKAAAGPTHVLSLLEAGTDGQCALLKYHWNDHLSESDADNLDTRARSFIACAIYDAAVAVGMPCTPGPAHGIRPSWHIATGHPPASLVSGSFDQQNQTCHYTLGPVLMGGNPASLSLGVVAEILARGFAERFRKITV